MSEGLLRLVYVSTAKPAVDEGELQAILVKSSARNPSDGITGLLCAGSGHYMQVLEGPACSVMGLYLRIMADPRHCDLTLLSISLVAERLFGQWAMAHIEGSVRSSVLQEVLLAGTDTDSRSDRAATILRRFVAALKDGSVPAVNAAVTY